MVRSLRPCYFVCRTPYRAATMEEGELPDEPFKPRKNSGSFQR